MLFADPVKIYQPLITGEFFCCRKGCIQFERHALEHIAVVDTVRIVLPVVLVPDVQLTNRFFEQKVKEIKERKHSSSSSYDNVDSLFQLQSEPINSFDRFNPIVDAPRHLSVSITLYYEHQLVGFLGLGYFKRVIVQAFFVSLEQFASELDVALKLAEHYRVWSGHAIGCYEPMSTKIGCDIIRVG